MLPVRRTIRAGTVLSRMVKPAFPYAADPIAVPEYAAPEYASAKDARAENSTHQNSGFETAAIPFAFQQNGSPIHRVRAKRFLVIELPSIQYLDWAVLLHGASP